MQELLDILGPELTPLITNLLLTLVGVLFTYLGIQAQKLMTRVTRSKEVHQIKEAFEANQEFAKATVEYVEKIGEQIGIEGEEKFELAKIKLIEVLEQKGISISEAEIDMLIEQAHTAFSSGYNREADVVVIEEKEQEVL